MYLKKSIIMGLSVVFLMLGCSHDEDTVEFNKPAIYWYKQMAKSLSSHKLDKADSYYISLKSEHMRSPLMPTAILMLAHAHMNADEYLLANYYLDEYSKRFGEGSNQEYIAFLKLKASFLGVKDVYKDQKLIMDSITNAKTYLLRYPESVYAPLVNTILIRLHMSQYLLNENIASLYERTGKPDAAEIYREKNSDSVIEMSDISAPEKGMIAKIFD